MARPQAFNESLVVSRAIECFWTKGYSEASLADLLSAMKISRSTFYNSFGDKRQLFELCLQTYSKQAQQIISMTLLNDKTSVFEAIKQFFYVVLVAPDLTLSARGCFLVNSITETAEVNDELHQLAIDLIQPVKLGLIYQLRRVFSVELSNQHGEWLFTQLLGWRLQCQVGLPKDVLEQQINWSLLQLETELESQTNNLTPRLA